MPSEEVDFHVCVEGGIGSGKTTLIRALQANLLTSNINSNIFPEPINIWTAYGSERINLLKNMYNDPSEHAFKFQTVAAISRLTQLRDMSGLSIVERSILSQKKVFVPLLVDSGMLDPLEEDILSEMFTNLSKLPCLIPDIVIYLRSSPEKCLERIQIRNREEETGIDLDYLQRVNRLYDSWLLSHPAQTVIAINGNDIQDRDIHMVAGLIKCHRDIQQLGYL